MLNPGMLISLLLMARHDAPAGIEETAKTLILTHCQSEYHPAMARKSADLGRRRRSRTNASSRKHCRSSERGKRNKIHSRLDADSIVLVILTQRDVSEDVQVLDLSGNIASTFL